MVPDGRKTHAEKKEAPGPVLTVMRCFFPSCRVFFREMPELAYKGVSGVKNLIVYVRGKGGTAEKAAYYKPLFQDSAVIGPDYRAQPPWEAGAEFSPFFREGRKGRDRLMPIANGIGADRCARRGTPVSQRRTEAFLDKWITVGERRGKT